MLLEIHVSGLNINKNNCDNCGEFTSVPVSRKSTDKCHKPQIPIQFKIQVRFCIPMNSNGSTLSHKQKNMDVMM